MHPTKQPALSPKEVARILVVHPKRWMVPALAIGLVALVYAAVRRPTWEASQALVVRNEVASDQSTPGKFNHTDEMKTVQETILELVKSRGVLTAALAEVGPPADYKRDKAAWPTARDIARFRKDIKLAPPKGAEFGKTEVFYLKVRSKDRARSVALTTVIVEELKSRFQQLLDDRAASIINELDKAVALAETDLADSSGRLTKLEKGVGSDLAELRILHESPSGDSDLRRNVVEVEAELRAAKTDHRANAELLSLLQTALSDPSRVEALPNRLLDSHATLRRLSEGLSTARLETSDRLGRMTDSHPLVQVAKAEQSEVLRNLNGELRNAIQIAEVELRLADARVESLEEQLADVRARFERLAGLRTPYANLVAERQNRTDLLQTARRTLADVCASQVAARTAGLIAQIGRPDTGARPAGLSRAMIALIGLTGGLLTGFGVLLLTVQPAPPAVEPQPAKHLSQPLPAVRSNGTAAQPSLQPGVSLSMRQALEKITYASKT
jgi:uncharacterized protein involved in exopolysaccharide biosynthesis